WSSHLTRREALVRSTSLRSPSTSLRRWSKAMSIRAITALLAFTLIPTRRVRDHIGPKEDMRAAYTTFVDVVNSLLKTVTPYAVPQDSLYRLQGVDVGDPSRSQIAMITIKSVDVLATTPCVGMLAVHRIVHWVLQEGKETIEKPDSVLAIMMPGD